jgi:hypothetical protein
MDAPQSVDAGRPFNVIVQVQDRFGNWPRGYAGTVRFGCSDPAAKVPADYVFERTEAHRTFTNDFTLPNAGRWTITVSDPAVKGLTASATVTVRPSRGGD